MQSVQDALLQLHVLEYHTIQLSALHGRALMPGCPGTPTPCTPCCMRHATAMAAPPTGLRRECGTPTTQSTLTLPWQLQTGAL